MTLKTPSGRAFLAVVVVAVALKIWLTSDIRILPIYAPHDELNFVEHARQVVAGNWFGPYTDMTLIKGPSFPLFLAFIDEVGLPLPLAHQLLYAVACLVACAAVRPIVRGWQWLAFVYVALLYNPFTDASSAWLALRSQINDSVALLALASAVAVYVRRSAKPSAVLPWLIGLGAAFAVFSFTREESIWLIFGLAGVLAAYLWSSFRQRRGELLGRAAACLIPVAIWAAYGTALLQINGHKYGWYTVVEVTSPEYIGAYNSLARIITPHRDESARRAAQVTGNFADIGVTREAREIAYSVSPAARELRPALEGAPGKEWLRISCSSGYSCVDTPSGWFVWALRDAVMLAGHYHTGADARAFYVQLASELDRACDDGLIRCRRKGRTLAPPIGVETIPAFARSTLNGIRLTVTFGLLNPVSPGRPAFAPGGLEDYELVTRDIDPEQSGSEFDGWVVDDDLQSLDIEAAGGVAASSYATFSISPDVYAAFATTGQRPPVQAALARFSISSTCVGTCTLVVRDHSGRTTRIPLTLTATNMNVPGVHYHLDNAFVKTVADGDAHVKQAVRSEIGRTYQELILPWVVVAVALCVLRIVRRVRRRRPFGSEQLVVAGGVTLAVGALIGVLGLVTAISFPALTEDYMIGIPVLLLYGVTVVVAVEGKVMWRLLYALVPPRARGRVERAPSRSG